MFESGPLKEVVCDICHGDHHTEVHKEGILKPPPPLRNPEGVVDTHDNKEPEKFPDLNL